MKFIDWDKEKNKKLKKDRGISFEEVLIAITDGNILDILKHPNTKHYPTQHLFVIQINNYAYIVPYVEDDEKYFLKTIIPSRKMTKKYLKGGEK